jgi:hypothetical protein
MQVWGKFNKIQKTILLITVLMLIIPFIEILDGNAAFNWSVFDFFLAFILLSSFGLILEFTLRKLPNKKSKFIVILIILFLFVLIWAELAVGIFNSPIAGD